MTTTLSTKGQIVIPAEFRARKSLKPGDRLVIEETEDGILLRKAEKTKPRLIEKDGLPVLQAEENATRITTQMVKELEADLL
ncbi:MAG: AbrB/MazE/SpoVT family DNA-binding domain-containing protein [Limisphaerales bacterium]